LRILLLSEGDPEKPFAFSGIGKNVVDNFRAAGHQVVPGDVDMYGLKRMVVGGLMWSPSRRRWIAKYRGATLPFQLRSRRARRHIAAHGGSVDAILQFGATFEPRDRGDVPYFLYCDSNKLLGKRSGYSQGATFTPREYAAAVERERRVYDGATGIFVFSERVRRSFIEDFGVPPEKVVTVFAGANLDLSRVPPRAPRPADRPPTVLFVGREFERKGGDVVLRAFAKVRRTLPAARLVIIGPEKLEVSDPGVESLGFLRKDSPDGWRRLLDAYASADVFFFPTRYEPFGIVLAEAMFFTVPCVATDAWAIPEIVADGETGYLAPVDDVDAFAERLLRLLTDPALALRMGEAGRARAERHFTWRAVTGKMLDWMQRALVPPAAAAR
jgi:glycosyltransferase involved in cell wall biosynthesis